jgi:DNA-binding winged helix-turn-helix (wHTH) protein/TolB-like protein
MDQQLTYALGETVLDLDRGTLRRNGELVALRPDTMRLLRHLAQNAGRVISKDELREAIGPRTAISDHSLAQCIRDARKSLGDPNHRLIRTVPRQGYLYAPISAEEDLCELRPFAHDDLDGCSAEPRVAVLPFRLAGVDPGLRGSFDRVVQEITTALSTSRALAVCPQATGMPAALVEASVDYLVRGEVRPGGSHLNVVITLSEARSGRRLLTQTFFLKMEGILAFHQPVARQVVSALVFNIETAAWQRTPEGSSSVHCW